MTDIIDKLKKVSSILITKYDYSSEFSTDLDETLHINSRNKKISIDLTFWDEEEEDDYFTPHYSIELIITNKEGIKIYNPSVTRINRFVHPLMLAHLINGLINYGKTIQKED